MCPCSRSEILEGGEEGQQRPSRSRKPAQRFSIEHTPAKDNSQAAKEAEGEDEASVVTSASGAKVGLFCCIIWEHMGDSGFLWAVEDLMGGARDVFFFLKTQIESVCTG